MTARFGQGAAGPSGAAPASAAIEDYAAIGDCRSVGLVSRGGSLDWLCWPRFDSPSIFGALLDAGAGYWRIAPATPFRSTRRYVGDTNVLETHFVTAGGSLRLTDLMPVASEEDKRKLLIADHEVIRIAQCDEGEVDVAWEFVPRPEYGRRTPRIAMTEHLGARITMGSALLSLSADVPLGSAEGGTLTQRILLRAGQAAHFSLTFENESMAVLPPAGAWSRACVARTLAWWNDWASHLRYDGPFRDAVVRSALALRLLLYAPSGAIVAAPTTSLPERVGGSLNWDYRFCWLRDASLTIRALFGLGYANEAEAFLGWLLHTTRLTRPELRVLYDVYGRSPPRERVLEHLSGYRGSRPVRIGNAAAGQFQLDVYGEVIDAAAQYVRQGGTLDRETRALLRGFGNYVVQNGSRPDHGIWETRSEPRHHTHSRLLGWVALDRLLALHDERGLDIGSVEDFRRERARIRRQIEEHAWNPTLGSYVATLNGTSLDASVLLIPWYGFEDAASPRMRRTYACLRERLGGGRELLYRYRDGEPSREGAFGVCGFWGAEFLALGGGTAEEAESALRTLIAFANDVVLFAEEIDPASGAALGNFPQAFTHVGLINAALSLEQRTYGRASLDRGAWRGSSDAAPSEVRL